MLATGGGAFIEPRTRAEIKARATSVWLRADLDLLWDRVRDRPGRPLLQAPDPRGGARRPDRRRAPIYAEADVIGGQPPRRQPRDDGARDRRRGARARRRPRRPRRRPWSRRDDRAPSRCRSARAPTTSASAPGCSPRAGAEIAPLLPPAAGRGADRDAGGGAAPAGAPRPGSRPRASPAAVLALPPGEAHQGLGRRSSGRSSG